MRCEIHFYHKKNLLAHNSKPAHQKYLTFRTRSLRLTEHPVYLFTDPKTVPFCNLWSGIHGVLFRVGFRTMELIERSMGRVPCELVTQKPCCC